MADGSSTDAGKTSTSIPAAAPATANADAGSITGLVTDDQLTPLVGATIALRQNAAIVTQSDAYGRFTLNDVPPGSYYVDAGKLGFDSQAKKADVLAGEILNLSFTLAPLAVEAPLAVASHFDGFFSCGTSSPVLTVACRDLVDSNDKTVYDSNLSAGAMTIIDTMTWDSSAPGTAKIFRDIISVTGGGSGAKELNGVSPLVVRIDEPTTKKTSKLHHLIWIGWTNTGDPTQLVVVVYQQKFHVLTTVFYGEPAPDGYTGIAP